MLSKGSEVMVAGSLCTAEKLRKPIFGVHRYNTGGA